MTSAAPDAATILGELEATNRLLVQQVFKPIANEYRISVPTPGSTDEGRPLLYVKQAKMKIRGGHPLPPSRRTTTSTCS